MWPFLWIPSTRILSTAHCGLAGRYSSHPDERTEEHSLGCLRVHPSSQPQAPTHDWLLVPALKGSKTVGERSIGILLEEGNCIHTILLNSFYWSIVVLQLAATVQQSRSVVCIHMSPPFWISFLLRLRQKSIDRTFPELFGGFSLVICLICRSISVYIDICTPRELLHRAMLVLCWLEKEERSIYWWEWRAEMEA